MRGLFEAQILQLDVIAKDGDVVVRSAIDDNLISRFTHDGDVAEGVARREHSKRWIRTRPDNYRIAGSRGIKRICDRVERTGWRTIAVRSDIRYKDPAPGNRWRGDSRGKCPG